MRNAIYKIRYYNETDELIERTFNFPYLFWKFKNELDAMEIWNEYEWSVR